MSNSILSNRREFVSATSKASLAFAIPTLIPAGVLGRNGATPPSEKIQLGVIGIGPRCKYVIAPILKFKDVRCRIIADVQASRREEGKKIVDTAYGSSDCDTLRDFREVLARKDIDAVLIATGDRWHATASMMAAEAGKDIYCEKPCGLTIDYCQRIDETVRRTGRIFQAGTQRRSVANFQQAVQMVHDGKLGPLKKMVASVYVPSIDSTWLPSEPTPDRNVVDWNMWLGPAPWRPFNKQYVAGKWRGQWDFDSGAKLLDWGAHTVDLCQWANQADNTMPIAYIPKEKGIECRYANGVILEIDFLDTPFAQRPGWIQSNGTCPVRFVGEKGWIETGDSGEIHLSILDNTVDMSKAGARRNGLDVDLHARNFFDCMRTRMPAVANSTVMRRSHIACHAAALSWILQRPLKIDPVSEKFVDDDEANRLQIRPQRIEWMS
ncbi:MAG: Gfo/Idh/MocA family protein [Pirellula sp.]|jgi:predicted dehydrogenase|nr:Gfo/Idh/MocA family oxidoreductase [Pirellula sp.]